MFELTSLSSFLNVFEKAIGLIDKRRDQKQRLFKEIVEPVYTELSSVVGEYYDFFRGCRDDFTKAKFKDFEKVLRDKRRKREEIVLARNKVLGITKAFCSKQHDILIKSKRREDELLYRFADEIERFFFASDNMNQTRASSLFSYIDYVIENQKASEKENIVERIEDSLQGMEHAWKHISVAYGELRVLCLS